jgi:capsular polysaccharide biosynthesis protein
VIDPGWRIDEPDPEDQGDPGSPLPTLASFDFMRDALRRRWPVWVIAAILGLLAGVAYDHAVPAKRTATVTVLLAHDPQQDPSRAMATDVRLLDTRAVAKTVIDQLHLSMTPDDLLQSVTAQAATDEVLAVKVTGPTDQAATTRAQRLVDNFLTFRATQLQSQTDILVRGYNQRVAALQAQVATLTQRIDDLSKVGAAGQNDLSDAVTQRAETTAQISQLQQTIQDATLRTTSVVAVSHVIDPASAVPQSPKRRKVLTAVSGLIGGLAIGGAIVLFLALTSGRLRRREEVSQALEAPVRVSVGRVRSRWPVNLLRLGMRRARKGRAARNLEVIARTLEEYLRPVGGRRAYLALVSVDSVEDTARITAELVVQAAARGVQVLAVDLSRHGGLAKQVSRVSGGLPVSQAAPPLVHRPAGNPALTTGPLASSHHDGQALAADEQTRQAWDSASCIVTFVEADPAGAERLGSWAQDAVLVVTAGQSSGERMRTIGELVRAAGIHLRCAVLLRADRTDDSLGLPEASRTHLPTLGAR